MHVPIRSLCHNCLIFAFINIISYIIMVFLSSSANCHFAFSYDGFLFSLSFLCSLLLARKWFMQNYVWKKKKTKPKKSKMKKKTKSSHNHLRLWIKPSIIYSRNLHNSNRRIKFQCDFFFLCQKSNKNVFNRMRTMSECDDNERGRDRNDDHHRRHRHHCLDVKHNWRT